VPVAACSSPVHGVTLGKSSALHVLDACELSCAGSIAAPERRWDPICNHHNNGGRGAQSSVGAGSNRRHACAALALHDARVSRAELRSAHA
jgi:hypothetical protein